MVNQKVIIIGAGMSGLNVGCYLQMNGYNTEIFEKHYLPGGLCSSWKRKGYTFDGCIHWVLGTNKGSAFNIIWNELLNLNEIEFVNHDVRVDIELKHNKDNNGNKVFHLYTQLDRLKSYLIDIASEDIIVINKFIKGIQMIQKYKLPPLIEKAPEIRTFKDKLKLLKYLPFLLSINKWASMTNYKFAHKFKNPFLKEAFELMFEGEEYTILIIMMQLAYFDKKCCGYPIGGSMNFAKGLEQRYLNLGGRINYNSTIEKVIIKDNRAKGIETNNNEIHNCDIVISACDWKFTIFNLLSGKYIDKKIKELYELKKLKIFNSAVYISLGISRTFDHTSHLLRFPLEEELILPDGTKIERMETHIYNYDPTLADDGKTVITVTLNTNEFDYWNNLRNLEYEKYEKVKEDIVNKVIDIIDKKFGNIKENIEVYDVATPATFYRYTNNWKGSIQGWFPPKKLFSVKPMKKELAGLKNFYMFSHWTEPGGGLPVAIKNGRDLAQIICKRDNREFIVDDISRGMK